MKRYILYLVTWVIMMSFANSAWGENKSGDVSATTISKSTDWILTGDVKLKGTITINAGVTLTINHNGTARTIKAANTISGSMFHIQSGGTLIIIGGDGKHIIIDGGAKFNGTVNGTSGHPFSVSGSTYAAVNNTGYNVTEAIQNENGTLTLEYVTIQNVYGSDANGGGILVTGTHDGDNRVTTIKSCIITNCVSGNGSALHVNINNDNNKGNAEKCKVVVKDTELCYNYSSDVGGTVRSNGNCVSDIYFTKVNCHHNYSKGSGGGIYWNGAGTAETCFYFNGCIFDSNVADKRGGGMMLETTYKFETDGDTTIISNNKVLSEEGSGGGIVVTSYGGEALYVQASKQYVFDYDLTAKLKIIGNTAYQGGGISFNLEKYELNTDWNTGGSNYSVTSNINFNGATISNNKATGGNGGGIRLFNNTAGKNGQKKVYVNVYLNSGTLSGNTADSGVAECFGGGIYTYNADIGYKDTSSGTLIIEDNIVSGNGGGIYVDGGTQINLGKTEIKNNSAKNGGALAISENSGTNLSIKLGTSTISGNHVSNNGGAIYLPNGTLTLESPTINDNYGVNGGAVYLGGGSLVTTGQEKISDNYATTYGGAIYVTNGSVTMNQPEIVNNGGKSDSEVKTQYGGAIYVTGTGAGFTSTGGATIKNNAATTHGGAIYVNNGGINIAGGEMAGNSVSTGNGGVFYVNGGNITLSQKTKMTENSAVNGGAIALTGGAFSIHSESEISNNTATNGGGLWVENNDASTSIDCIGGSFNGNAATGNGGALYANGSFTFNFAADVRSNSAQNGGGLYIDGGVKMNFGQQGSSQGLIVGNHAKAITQTTSDVNATAGTGGGIYLNKGQLAFLNPNSLGVYNNTADYQAADIYASGNSTTLNLPDVSGMNLTGFDVPGSALYWVKDFYNKRYENELLALSEDIEDLILNFTDDEISQKVKVVTETMCLDLGYDLVFVNLGTEGLNFGDAVSVSMFYNTNKDENSNPVWKMYRKALLHGTEGATSSSSNQTLKVGLPSGNWAFVVSDYSSEYESVEFKGYKRDDMAQTTGKEITSFAGDAYQFNIANDETTKLVFNYESKTTTKINTPQFIKVNKMQRIN